MNLVKLCGISGVQDVEAVTGAKPDRVGIVVDYPASPRNVAISVAAELAGAISIPVVAVTVNPSLELVAAIAREMAPATLQLSGDENLSQTAEVKNRAPSIELWKVIHLETVVETDESELILSRIDEYARHGVDVIMVDARAPIPGGSGKRVNWDTAQKVVNEATVPVILAGGLNPENVSTAIKVVRPWGVDVSSGIEIAPGMKSAALMQAFVENARRAFSGLEV